VMSTSLLKGGNQVKPPAAGPSPTGVFFVIVLSVAPAASATPQPFGPCDDPYYMCEEYCYPDCNMACGGSLDDEACILRACGDADCAARPSCCTCDATCVDTLPDGTTIPFHPFDVALWPDLTWEGCVVDVLVCTADLPWDPYFGGTYLGIRVPLTVDFLFCDEEVAACFSYLTDGYPGESQCPVLYDPDNLPPPKWTGPFEHGICGPHFDFEDGACIEFAGEDWSRSNFRILAQSLVQTDEDQGRVILTAAYPWYSYASTHRNLGVTVLDLDVITPTYPQHEEIERNARDSTLV